MNTFISILVVICGIVLFPAFVGALWIILIGLPIYGIYRLYDLIIKLTLNPVFHVINKIPVLGRLLTSSIAIAISLSMIALVFCVFEVPLVAFIVKAMGN